MVRGMDNGVCTHTNYWRIDLLGGKHPAVLTDLTRVGQLLYFTLLVIYILN